MPLLVLNPDTIWYCLNSMGAQKNALEKVLSILFFHNFNEELSEIV